MKNSLCERIMWYALSLTIFKFIEQYWTDIDIKTQRKKIEKNRIVNSASDSEFNWNTEFILGRDENYTIGADCCDFYVCEKGSE